MSLYKNVLKKIAWWLLVVLVVLIGAWLYWLEYRRPATWPDFPWELVGRNKMEQTQ